MQKFLPVLLSVFLLTGCATTQQSDSIKVASQLAYLTTRVGTVSMLLDHPEWRPAFVAGQAALDGLLRSSNYNVADFQNAISELPVPWFQNGDNAVWLSLGVFVWDSVSQTMFDVQSDEAVASIMQSVRNGIADALVAVKPTDVARRIKSVPVRPVWPRSKSYLVL